MSAIPQKPNEAVFLGLQKRTAAGALRWAGDRLVPLLGFVLGLGALLLGWVLLGSNELEAWIIPVLGAECLLAQVLIFDVYRQKRTWDLKLALLAGLLYAAILAMYFLPSHWTGLELNAIIHRTIFGMIFLFVSGVWLMAAGVFYMLGGSLQAGDISRYPLLITPVGLALGVYAVLILQIVVNGLPGLQWEALSQPYYDYVYPVRTAVGGDWPAFTTENRTGVGILNHILGTGTLMLLTTLMALPVGVGTGIFLSEYASDRFGNLLRFIITSLRSISTLILGMTALSLVRMSSGTVFAFLTKGFRFDGFLLRENEGGSFFLASLVLSLLIIPIITRATEEGCRSLPPELREGSLALGANEEITLRRITLPWSLPNIVTGALLGCAEAAGDMAVLFFIAGRGDFGVGAFQQVTSLAYLVFDVYWGTSNYKSLMGPYQFTAGLILMLITIGLGISALFLKRWLRRRYQGR